MTDKAERAGRFDRAAGLTLIELMITVAVGTVLLLLAAPDFATVVQRNRISSAAEQLYVTLAEARGEAVKRRRPVRVCPSADSASCRNDGNWSDGWLIFQDADNDGTPDAAEIIKAVPGTSLANGVSLGSDVAVETFVEFGSTGATIDSGTAGRFWICHSASSERSREIRIALSGRIEDTTRAQTDCGVTT